MNASIEPARQRPRLPIWMVLVILGLLFGSTACTRLRIRSCAPVPPELTRLPDPGFQQLPPHPTRRQQLAELNKTETDRRRARRRLAIIDAQQKACRE